MVAGCPVAEDGEHYGIDGKLVRISVNPEKDFTVTGHFVGECMHCGREIYFTAVYTRYEGEYGPDTLEPVHLKDAIELEIE